ncbi:MAG: peptidylprolyl isomerase [Gammaproteobacteria bacterium]|jgi:peptidyl-prolyl cis-trans isomerase SurA|nr:peptidylprolyl isomerase [Gammaproteobacteria bacterium]
MNMLNIRSSALLLALALAVAAPRPAAAQNLDLSDSGVLVDGIAAVVNDGVVLLSELDEQTSLIVQRLREENTQLPPRDVLIPQILERLVMNEIQLQRAAQGGIVVPDAMLNRALADIARRNGTTLSRLPELLAQDGVDYNAYRKEMRQQLILDQLRQREVVSRIGVTPRELEDYLDRARDAADENNRYKISHILISVPSVTNEADIAAAQAKVEALYTELQNGADFAALAIANSDAQTALEGGSMGWRQGDSLPTLFANVVPELEVGQVSRPIRSPSGFHLVRLDGIEGNEPVLQDQVLARHILMETNEIMDDSVVRQRLTEIRQGILDGDDFAAIAKAVSDDPGSAIEGGELGWTDPGIYVPEFQEALAALEPNEISEPFKSPFGWHIVEVLDRRVHDATDDVARQRAIMAIRESKMAEESELWLRQMRDEAFVEYRL